MSRRWATADRPPPRSARKLNDKDRAAIATSILLNLLTGDGHDLHDVDRGAWDTEMRVTFKQLRRRFVCFGLDDRISGDLIFRSRYSTIGYASGFPQRRSKLREGLLVFLRPSHPRVHARLHLLGR